MWIYTVSERVSEFTICPNLPDSTLLKANILKIKIMKRKHIIKGIGSHFHF